MEGVTSDNKLKISAQLTFSKVRGGNNVKTKNKINKYPDTIRKIEEVDFINIRDDIVKQLDSLSKFGKYYDDLVNEYLSLLSIREALKEDIDTKGIRYKFTNGNGKKQEKANESVANLIKIEQIMLKISNDLGINQSFLNPSNQIDKNNKTIGADEDDLL